MREKIRKLAEYVEALLVLVQKIIIRAVDMVYPPCCPFCDQPLRQQEWQMKVCRNCQKQAVYITNNHCLKCGKFIYSEKEEFCYDCSRYSHHYDQARSILSYQGKSKEALYRFKKSNRKEYAEFFGEEICRLLGRWIYNCRGDYLIPIPLYYKSEGGRGYNQADILAKVISRKTGIPVCENLLQKVMETKQQKDLDKTERRKNLENAFVVLPEHRALIDGKTVILIDDIYTTGATADAASKVLKDAGAARVFVVTVAIGG